MNKIVLGLLWIATLVGAFLLGDFLELNRETVLPNEYGRFLSKPKVELLGDRNIKLLEDFVYIDPYGDPWLAPKDSEVNGASIPRMFWTMTGGPLTGKFRNASIVHDVECDEMKRPWEKVHLMFYHAMLAGGVEKNKAMQMYWAVARFGPRWAFETRTRAATFTGPDGQVQTFQIPQSLSRRIESDTPTQEDFEWAASYFEQNEPPVELIPSLGPGEQVLKLSKLLLRPIRIRSKLVSAGIRI